MTEYNKDDFDYNMEFEDAEALLEEDLKLFEDERDNPDNYPTWDVVFEVVVKKVYKVGAASAKRAAAILITEGCMGDDCSEPVDYCDLFVHEVRRTINPEDN